MVNHLFTDLGFHLVLVLLQTALKAQLLKPEMVCYKGHSQINCMQAIKNGYVDFFFKLSSGQKSHCFSCLFSRER